LAFDFDGTIGDSLELESETMLFTIQKYYDPSFTQAMLIASYGPTEEGIIRRYVPKEKGDEAWAYSLSLYRKLSPRLLSEPFPGMRELLAKYGTAPKLLTVLLTGRSKETLAISLKDLGIEGDFQKTYTGSLDGINKDQSLLRMLKDFGLEKKDVLYIGDTIEDVKTMGKIGVDILSAGYGHDKEYQAKLEALNPGRVAHSVRELDELLAQAIK
jgi:phosphoglycolate phosphatase-like HAD superfamily hydrolase